MHAFTYTHRLFDHSFHEDTVLPRLRAEVEPDFREVDGAVGITVKCGDTNCIFEFITYKYIGEVERKPNATLVEHTPGSNDEPLTRMEPHTTTQDGNRLQPMPVNSRARHLNSDFQQESLSHNDSDHDYSSLSPPLHPQQEPLQRMSSEAHLPKLEQRTFDLSPHARLKRQRTLEEATLCSSSNVPNNDLQVHSSDSNRREYTAEQGKRSNQLEVDVHIGASASCAVSQGPNNTTRHGTGGSNLHYQSQRSQTISSTAATMPLSSIDEDGSYESTESSVLSPESVFTTPTDQ